MRFVPPRLLLRLVAIVTSLFVCCNPLCCTAFMSPTMVGSGKRSLKVGVPVGPIQFRHCIPMVASSLSSTRCSSLLQASSNDHDNEPTEEPTTASAEESSESVVTQDDGDKKKNTLSLVPLFFKFCVVLAVKFITDVLVFPPLFLWRFVRLLFRKCRNVLLGKGSKGGSASATS